MVGLRCKLFPSDLNKEYLSSSEHVHITGLSFDTALAAAKIAKKANITVSFDPGRLMSKVGLIKLLPLLRHVDQILLNQDEARELTGANELEKAAKTLLKFGPQTVIIKRGSDGVFAMNHSESFGVPAYSVKVADTTGAGDAFSAGFITAQLEGKNLEDSVEFANATANLKITRVGARALPNRKAVERFLKKRKESQ
ncbi:MAG: carbohydrate kinase family protein [Candidatus Bathyarchaeia archaeon]